MTKSIFINITNAQERGLTTPSLMKRSLGTSIVLRLWTTQCMLPTTQSALATKSKFAFTTMASSQSNNQANINSQSFQHAQQDSVESKNRNAPWKLYPIECYSELRTKHGNENIKVIHMVRHAEGTHNVDGDYKHEKNLDARLTEKGMAQCQSLAQLTQAAIMKDLDIDDVAVITSPMTRCVQTAFYSFPWLVSTTGDSLGNNNNNIKVPFVALESIRETVNFACDRRRSIREISQEYPRVDFFQCCNQDNDFIWDNYRSRLGKDWEEHMESGELNVIVDRAREGFEYLQGRPEHHLFVCSHSAFLRCILNWGQEGGVPQMPPQLLDDRHDKTNHKLFEFCGSKGWEEKMRSNYENCELRSFCMLVQHP